MSAETASVGPGTGSRPPVLSRAVGVFGAQAFFLAQPGGFPERVIRSDPDTFFDHFLQLWRSRPGALPDDVRCAYLESLRSPEAIRAVCDPDHDAADCAAGMQLTMPVLAVWEDPAKCCSQSTPPRSGPDGHLS